MHCKLLSSQMELAYRRNELVERKMVERQATWLLLAMGQKVLHIPQTYCHKLTNADVKTASAILREMSLSILEEVHNLPLVATTGWLDKTLHEEDADADGR